MGKLLSLRADSPPPLRLGERLTQDGFLSADQLQIALHEQKRSRDRLGLILVRLGFIDEKKLADALASQTGFDSVDLKNAPPDASVLRLIPPTVARRCRALPVAFDGATLFLAMADPHDISAIDEVRRHVPHAAEVVPLVAAAGDIADILESLAPANGIASILHELENIEDEPRAADGDWEHPIVRIVDALLSDAVREGASDIHFEPEASFVRLRMRIDGALRQTRALHKAHWPELSHRLKIMAGMNIAETRRMQDGRFHRQIGGASIDFRMAIMPTVQGENIVIRVLDHRRALLPLDKLGYDGASLTRLDRILERPEGIVLVTGPTGSGKTTTLYAVLKKLCDVGVNIMTLEDPVEYQFEMIRQTAIHEQQGLGFAEGVRGILRQAPDIIFIGEIRDADTAQMAIRAAMTGHLVFSTLHCNDSFGVFPRLADLGLSPRLLSENISGVMAQRLVRKLCPHCRKERTAAADEIPALAVSGAPVSGFAESQSRLDETPVLADAVGCAHCGHSGYRGRMAVTEVLRMTPEMDALVAADAPRAKLRRQAAEDGFVSMAADGIAKVSRRETSLDELRRNVDLTRGI